MKQFLSVGQYRVIDHLASDRMFENVSGLRDNPTFVEKFRFVKGREMGEQLLLGKVCNRLYQLVTEFFLYCGSNLKHLF